MKISRLFEMLCILVEHNNISAPELARRLEVSVRTVYRDAQALSEAGVPICTKQGHHGGICILPGYRLSRSFLNAQERSELLAALQAMQQTGASESHALVKLSSLFGLQERDWVQIDFSDWSGTQGALLDTLKRAILMQRVISFDYSAESSTLASRHVCPYKLWFKGQSWYLRAYCLKRKAIRTFKLTRIQNAQIIAGEFPSEAIIAAQSDTLSSEYETPVLQEIVLRVHPCMAFRALDDFGAQNVARLEDGYMLVKAAFPPGAWITSIILGYGEHAEVIAPPDLRAQISETIGKMNSLYKT